MARIIENKIKQTTFINMLTLNFFFLIKRKVDKESTATIIKAQANSTWANTFPLISTKLQRFVLLAKDTVDLIHKTYASK